MSSIRNTSEVTLIGAGLAGSLLAILLARRGFTVTIYERRPDMRRGAVAAGRSINLALANRGIRALEECGVMERVWPLVIPMAGRMLHHESGDLQLLPYGTRPHEVIYSVSRGGLNSLLMDAAEATGRVSIHFGHGARSVDFEQSEIEIVTPGAIVRAPYQVVIGTDGSASAVRASIVEAANGSFEEDPLDHGYKELTIPPGAHGEFQLERNALHIWPRGEFMLIALPNIDASFTVTLFLPNDGPESFAALTTPESVIRLFERRFPDARDRIPDLADEFFSNPTGRLGTVHCWPWHLGDQALLVGDAAHAIVPFHGQGMNCAFEDCSELGRRLDIESGWKELFENFERERKPNADAIAEMALENYVEMRSSVRDPKFQLVKELSFRLEHRHPSRFIPRYSMVMFHSMPYADALARGQIEAEILDSLTRNVASIDQIDFALADRLITERLTPLQ